MADLRAWVGCLACYNGGDLVGAWFDAEECGDVTLEGVHTVGRASGGVAELAGHEELWCFDLDGFGGLISGECSPMEAARVASLVADLDDDRLEALGAFRANYGGEVSEDMLSSFGDSYVGRFDSEKDYAYEWAEESGADLDSAGWPFSCIDWDRAARELFMDGFWSADTSGGVHVFRDV